MTEDKQMTELEKARAMVPKSERRKIVALALELRQLKREQKAASVSKAKPTPK